MRCPDLSMVSTIITVISTTKLFKMTIIVLSSHNNVGTSNKNNTRITDATVVVIEE